MKLRTAAKQAVTTLKVIFSIPDYEKYLKHHDKFHPDGKVMTENEFYMYSLKERYESGKINRCC